MGLVVDSSLAACWCLPDEVSATAKSALRSGPKDGYLVPALFWFEFRNVLIINERRGRLTPGQSESALQLISRLIIVEDRTPNEPRVLHLARHHRLTVYDAAYLELAQRHGVPLATLDTQLAIAAARESVIVIE